MMAGPGDEIPAVAAGLGRLRASRADRERAIDVLKAAFVQGRLAKDEFDARIGQVLTSRSYADLAAVTADLPVRLTVAQPVRTPGRVRPRRPVPYAVKWGAYGFLTPAIFVAALAIVSSSGSAALSALVVLALLYLVVWVPASPRKRAGSALAAGGRLRSPVKTGDARAQTADIRRRPDAGS